MEDVIFKGHKDKLVIVFNGQRDFEQLKNNFYTKLDISKGFFKGAKKTCVEFEGYDLSDEQKSDLLDIFRDKTRLEISLGNDLKKYAGNNLMCGYMSSEAVNKAKEVKKHSSEADSIVHKNSLRGGQFIHYNGNVIVIGDVNPGAEIICTGSIVVMGKVKGFVHAGCNGDKNCLITALSMAPVQLRIANIVSCMPEKKIVQEPSYAYINNDRLYISSLT